MHALSYPRRLWRGLGAVLGLVKRAAAGLEPVDGRGWWTIARESFAGAWQQNITIELANVMTFSTVFACVTLIAADIAKMSLRLVQRDENDIWTETTNPSYSPVLRRPNRYQIRLKFIEHWILSKLSRGNTYVLKARDGRGIVTGMYILDPTRVTPLVAPDGSVWYQLAIDHLSGLTETSVLTVPASEIIHDTMYTLYHPLVGISPIHACGLAAVLGLKIQSNSQNFFANGSKPGGVITAPGQITKAQADDLKEKWETAFSGDKMGKVAVLGDGMKYEGLSISSLDAQLIEQLRWTSEAVCACFHVPGYMVGVGVTPAYNNVQVLNQQYYSQCLQVLVETIEALLDDGLGIGLAVTGTGAQLGTEFDVDDLLRMDSATMMSTIKEGIGCGVLKPNEGRAKLNLAPVTGGDTPYLQQQNFSLAALDKRDQLAPAPSTTASSSSASSSSSETSSSSDASSTPPRRQLAAAFSAKLLTKIAEGIDHAA